MTMITLHVTTADARVKFSGGSSHPIGLLPMGSDRKLWVVANRVPESNLREMIETSISSIDATGFGLSESDSGEVGALLVTGYDKTSTGYMIDIPVDVAQESSIFFTDQSPVDRDKGWSLGPVGVRAIYQDKAVGIAFSLATDVFQFIANCRLLSRLSQTVPSRRSEMSWPVSPVVARSAIISPTTLQNLNPLPENPAAKKTFGNPGRASMMKCSSGVFVNMQALSAIVGPFASGK